jgi:hypothetical protein
MEAVIFRQLKRAHLVARYKLLQELFVARSPIRNHVDIFSPIRVRLQVALQRDAATLTQSPI